jgi:hypothetical protein
VRYEREVSLRFIGDVEECKKYIAQARTVLGEVYNRDIEIGGLDQAWRRVELFNGIKITVHWNLWMPLITIDVSALAPDDLLPQASVLRLAWVPEGIVLTPVNEEFPDGQGLPNRTAAVIEATETEAEIPSGTIIKPVYGEVPEDELEALIASAETILTGAFGTKVIVGEGVNPQVLLNKYANNKYLDEKDFVTGVPEEVTDTMPEQHPRRRATYETDYPTDGFTFVISWQLLFNPLSCPTIPDDDDGTEFWADPNNLLLYGQEPGVYSYTDSGIGSQASAGLLLPQFTDLKYTSQITENESERWYCHRPEELLYGTPAQEGVFEETNTIRDEAGRGPMYRQLRGYANASRMAVEEVAISRRLTHDDDQFRPGYFTMAGRAMNAAGRNLSLENLLVGAEGFATFEDGQIVARLWADSAPHYANQVSTYWDDEDFPGAEHSVGVDSAEVDFALHQGELDPPVGGIAVCQGFAKHEWWLPPTTHHHEGTHGVIGFIGSDQVWGREEWTETPYITFNKHVYWLSQFDGDDDFRSILGAAAYLTLDGRLRFRVVVALADEDLLDEPTGWLTIQVLTRDTRRTEQNPVYDCDWDLEEEFTYENSEGWYPYPTGQIKFAPNGEKFVMQLCKVTHSYSDGLTKDATDFSVDRSALVRPRRTIQQAFIEYKYNEGSLEWGFTDELEPALRANVVCTTSGTENIYSRRLKGTVKMFADYDALGELVYVYAYVDELSYQRYNSSGPETENYGYRYRKLIFPSDKEIVYLQQYWQDCDSLTDPIDIASRNWPGLPSEGSFIRRLSHLDVVQEDVVYHHINWNTKFLGKDTFGIFGYADSIGTQHVAMDLSFDDLETTQEREYQILWGDGFEDVAGPTTTWMVQQFVIVENEDFIDSTNRTNGPYPNHVEMTHAKGVYCMDQSVQSMWANETGGGDYLYYRQVFPTPYARFEDTTNGQPEVEIMMYKETTPIDNMYGRPPYADYYVSCAPGLSLFRDAGNGDNGYVFGNPLVWGSTQTGNIAPLMAHDDNVQCKIVRYKGRTVLRHETVRIPFAIPATTQTTFVGVDAAYLDVPDDLKVLLYTNFDLDEAVGMDDVTDIYPFGRV